MIPGNRPEDEWYDVFIDKVEVPDELVGLTDPEALAASVNFLLVLLSMHRTESRVEAIQELTRFPDPQELEQCDEVLSQYRAGGKTFSNVSCTRSKGHHGGHRGFTDLQHEVNWHDA